MRTSKLRAQFTMFTEIVFRVHYEFLLCSVLLTLHASATKFNIQYWKFLIQHNFILH